MVTKIAKASTVHRKRLQAPTITTMDLAMGSGAIGCKNDVAPGVFVDFAMLCYRQSEKKPAGAPLIQKHGCAVDPKTRKNAPARISEASWHLIHGLAMLNPWFT